MHFKIKSSRLAENHNRMELQKTYFYSQFFTNTKSQFKFLIMFLKKNVLKSKYFCISNKLVKNKLLFFTKPSQKVTSQPLKNV